MFAENMASRARNIAFFSNELQRESKLRKTEAVKGALLELEILLLQCMIVYQKSLIQSIRSTKNLSSLVP